jgi:hypothetical protein
MILPFSVKIGPILAEVSSRAEESNNLPAASVDFEYARKCWHEVKTFVDRSFDEEINRAKLSRVQTAKTRLGIEILDALSKQVVDENLLTKELIKTGKFSKQEATDFLQEAVNQGLIHQSEQRFYATNRISLQ